MDYTKDHWKFFLTILERPLPSFPSDKCNEINDLMFSEGTKHCWIILLLLGLHQSVVSWYKLWRARKTHPSPTSPFLFQNHEIQISHPVQTPVIKTLYIIDLSSISLIFQILFKLLWHWCRIPAKIWFWKRNQLELWWQFHQSEWNSYFSTLSKSISSSRLYLCHLAAKRNLY